MKPFAWGWVLCLFLAPTPGALPECAAVEEVEESERHAERSESAKHRKRTASRPRRVARPFTSSPLGGDADASAGPGRIGIWVSRTHQRSPTA